MFENSILGKVYSFYLYSELYKILRAIYMFFSNAYNYSSFKKILIGESKFSGWWRETVIAKFVDKIVLFFSTVIQRIIHFLTPAADGSIVVKLCRGSFVLQYDVFFSLLVFGMLLIPHELWKNGMGIVFGIMAIVIQFVNNNFHNIECNVHKSTGLPFAIFVVTCLWSVCIALVKSDSIRILIFFVAAFAFMFAAALYLSDTERLKKLLFTIYCVTIFMSVVAIAQRILGIEPMEFYTDLTIFKNQPGRVFSTVENPNNFAEVLVLFTPLAVSFAAGIKDNTRKFIASIALLLPIVAMLMTYSRSGWLSTALCVALYVYLTNKRLLPCIGLVALLCIPFLPASIMERLLGIFNTEDSSASFRIELWKSTLAMLSDDLNWLRGIGSGVNNYIMYLLPYTDLTANAGIVHSQMLYMELVVENGLLGLLSFGWFFFEQIRDAFVVIYRKTDDVVNRTLVACVSSFIGIAILCFFEYIWFYPRVLYAYFIVMGIMIGSIRLGRKCINEK